VLDHLATGLAKSGWPRSPAGEGRLSRPPFPVPSPTNKRACQLDPHPLTTSPAVMQVAQPRSRPAELGQSTINF